MRYYISVTGLRLKSLWYYPMFLKYALPSVRQAKAAQGNVETRTTVRQGVQHTLTAWDDKNSMLRYMRTGAHAKAMKVSNEMSVPGGTKVYGYESDVIPSWNEALDLWEKHGTRHGKLVPTAPAANSALGVTTVLASSLLLAAVAAATVLATWTTSEVVGVIDH